MTKAEVEAKCVQYQRYVGHIIAKRLSYFNNDEDIYQEGMIGLWKAVKTYDPNLGFSFMTYAARCIVNQILMEIRRKNNYAKHNAVSLDTVISTSDGESETDLYFFVPSKEDDYSRAKEALTEILRLCRNQREKEIIFYRLNGLNQKEIGEKMSLSQSYISRLLRDIKKQLDA